jgi:hypothetical protein
VVEKIHLRVGIQGTVLFQGGTLNIGGDLTLNDAGKVLFSAGANKVLRAGELATMNPAARAKIDLADNAMIVGAASPEIRQWIIDGRGPFGARNSNGIASVTAATIAPNSSNTQYLQDLAAVELAVRRIELAVG